MAEVTTKPTDLQGGEPQVQGGEPTEQGANAAAQGEEGQPADKSPREVLYERIRTMRPDAKYDENEDEYYSQASGILDDLEREGEQGKTLQEKLMRRFEEDPEEAQALLDYMDGMPLVAAIRKNKGDEALTMQEGMDGWEEYQQAGADRKKRFDDQRALLDEIRSNSELSEKDFDEFAAENKLNDEQKEAVRQLIQGDLENLSKGRITKEIYGRYRNALNHDSDVEGAHEQGRVEGKNEAIEAKKAKMAGSGLPNGSAGGNANEEIEEGTGNPTADFLRSIRRK